MSHEQGDFFDKLVESVSQLADSRSSTTTPREYNAMLLLHHLQSLTKYCKAIKAIAANGDPLNRI